MTTPSKKDTPEQIEMTPDGFVARYGERRYELRAIERPNDSRLKATVKAVNGQPGRFHIDTVDFYLSRSRRVFISEVARLFREGTPTIEEDIIHLISHLERYVTEQSELNRPTVMLLNDADRAEGMTLAKNLKLIAQIETDLEGLGLVGESANKLLLYLALTSRKMEDPLAVQILSGSGAGKSYLQDTVLALCPPEDLTKVTSLTDQALFYKGQDALRHKVLALEEVTGSSGARYALRNLISSKRLTIESTTKNPLTGKLESQLHTVNGPTAVFETTTNPDTDAETKSRYIILSVDESPAQTRAILQAQRTLHTVEGWLARKQREAVIKRHQVFQRLLKPVIVVNPFEPFLAYADEWLSVRRDQPKYLNLILAITFLHQYQRPMKTHPQFGDYIETTLEDIATANRLAHELFGNSLDELSGPSRELLNLLTGYVEKRAQDRGIKVGEVQFQRREIRDAIRWSDTRLRIHLEELARMEYIQALAGRFGQTYRYRLLIEPEELSRPGKFLLGLKSVETLRAEANLADQKGHLAPTSPKASARFKHGSTYSSAKGSARKSGNLAARAGERIRK